jgi:hypothetical protein
MAKRRYLTIDEIADAIRSEHGMITRAAAKLNVSRISINKRVKRSQELQAVLQDAREGVLDDAETGLWIAIQNHEAWAIAFTLRTIGRHRGYVERQEIAGADGNELRVQIEYVNDWRSHSVALSPPGADDSEADGQAFQLAGGRPALA